MGSESKRKRVRVNYNKKEPSERSSSGQWTEEETIRLIEEVRDMGGKITKWYVILADQNKFPGRSPHSINSYYNQLLRQMCPLIDKEVLQAEQDRRHSLKVNQSERIKAGKRNPLKTDVGYGSWRRNFGLSVSSATSYYDGKELVPVIVSKADKLLSQKPKHHKSMYKHIYWGKFTDKFWPCLTVPPNCDFDTPSVQALADRLLKDKSSDKILVCWFGSGDYGLVAESGLQAWTSENSRIHLATRKKSNSNDKAHSYENLLVAFTHAEMFIRGRPADDVCERLFELCKFELNVARKFPLTNNSDNIFSDGKSVVNLYEDDINSYLESKSENLVERMNHILVALAALKFTREELEESRMAEYVGQLCFSTHEEIAELAQSLIRVWNEDFFLFEVDDKAEEKDDKKDEDIQIRIEVQQKETPTEMEVDKESHAGNEASAVLETLEEKVQEIAENNNAADELSFEMKETEVEADNGESPAEN